MADGLAGVTKGHAGERAAQADAHGRIGEREVAYGVITAQEELKALEDVDNQGKKRDKMMTVSPSLLLLVKISGIQC